MCGVVGFAWAAKRPSYQIRELADTIRHRGPDEYGSVELGSCVLANRRLSIIDVEHGHQPLYNEDKSIAVVFNGQIYNHAQLRKKLIAQRNVLNSKSDG